MKIHPTAQVDPKAVIADDAEIGPYCIVPAGVVVGSGSVLSSHIVLFPGVRIGKNNIFYPFSSIGGEPQDLKFGGEQTWLDIGDRNTFREYVTINRGTATGGGRTVIGSDTLIMAYCHIAHDCIVEDRVIATNGLNIGGHVRLEVSSRFAGLVGVNPFVTVGTMAYVGGLSRIVQDVPPYMIVEGNPAEVRSVNVIGLVRNGLSTEQVEAIEEAFRLIWRTKPRNVRAAIEKLEGTPAGPTPEVAHLIQFLRNQVAGKNGRAREALRH